MQLFYLSNQGFSLCGWDGLSLEAVACSQDLLLSRMREIRLEALVTN